MGNLLYLALANAVMAAALALLVAPAARLLRRPALAHALWLLVLLKLVTPPLIPVPLPWPAATDEAPAVADAEPVVANLAGAPGRLELLVPEFLPEPPAGDEAAPLRQRPAAAPASLWLAVLVPLWLGTSACWLAWTALHVRRFRKLLRHAQRAPAELQDRAAALAARLGMRRHPAVWLVHGAVSPMLWALGRTPRLLFPSGLLAELDREQQDALLAHELAHWRRRDHWVRLLELLVFAMYWWHPVVWWARHELHEAEEECCDAWVVWATGGASRTYALALVQTAAFLSNARPALPLAASAVGPVHHLRRRLTMIMQGTTPRALSYFGGAVVLGLGVLLPLLPVGAQETTPLPVAQPPAAKDQRGQQIEALKEAIRALEAQRAAEKQAKKDAKKDAAKTRDEFTHARAEFEASKAHLDLALANYRKALARYEQLGGKAPAQPGYTPVPLDATPRFTPPAKVEAPYPPRYSTVPVPPKVQPHGELERKLDRLLKEVDELRRELRGRKTPTPMTPGTSVPPPAARAPVVEPPPALTPRP